MISGARQSRFWLALDSNLFLREGSMGFWKSKKFWMTVASLGLVVLNRKLSLGLTDEAIIGLGGAYNLGQGLADFGKHAKG